MTLALLLTAATGAWAAKVTHWPDFNKQDYAGSNTFVAAIQIDGEIITAADPRWDALEVAFFVGNECRGNGNYLYNGYVEEYEEPYPIINGASIFYNNAGEQVSVKMYDHINGILYEDCVVTLQGEPLTILTGEKHQEGWDDPYNPVFLSFTTAAPSGPEVDWNKTSKTGTFDMPGGNVELEPEYYPQAVLTAAPKAADGAKATTDDLLVSGGTVATITGSDPAAPQGTLMYYVSTSTMTTEALLALDAAKWVAEPTAAGITQKCGAFVYYYVKGNDSTDDALNFSDGDISSDNFLNVAIYPAPTYAVTFADDLAEPTLWTASPNADVTKGQTVTVTYTGTKKVLGVKAEKKAGDAGKSLAEATVGMLVGSDGKTYAAADKNNLPEGVTAVALVCYVSDGHGLALALADESSSKMTWNTAKSTCSGKTPAVTGCTWKLATKDEWNNMINAAGGFSALRDGFSSVGGTNMLSGSNDYYWSSTTTGSDCAWCCTFSTGNWTDDYADDYCTDYVRACLAF